MYRTAAHNQPAHVNIINAKCTRNLQVAELLAQLHMAGLVHRTLTPHTLRWLPHRLDWALVGFGCSAKAGARSTLAAADCKMVLHLYMCC